MASMKCTEISWRNKNSIMASRNLLSWVLLMMLSACGPQQQDQENLAFPGLEGPQVISSLPAEPLRTSPAVYRNGSPDSLGILVLDESSSWLGLVHGLKSQGVPVRVLTEIEAALEHDVLMVYPSLTGSGTAPEVLQKLAAHVRSGNTLLAFSVIGGGMPDLFGFSDTVEHENRSAVQFPVTELSSRFVFEPSEATVRLAPLPETGIATRGMPGVSYSSPRRDPIAVYSDGSTAISHNFFSAAEGDMGHAYAIGFDIGHYVLRAHNGRLTGFSADYVNAYQPAVDTLLRFIATVYRQGEPDAVLLSAVPEGRSVTVLITHDVDYTRSLLNAVDYARDENRLSVSATYFIQSKYLTDYNDSRFFEAAQQGVLDQLNDLGAEIASHSVAHSNEFRFMPVGSGAERYPQYQPFVEDFTTVRSASILGELRVSKFLLEQTMGQEVRAFRPGHLSLPERLPELLQATGYEFSSSITANEALTHLPYRLMYSRGYDMEVDVYEFPVTFEDEQWRLEQSLPQVLDVTRKIARHGGLVNLLIHTETTGEKLGFQSQFINALGDIAHYSSVNDFGDWWRARDSIALSVSGQPTNQRSLTITADAETTGLTLELPGNWRYEHGLEGTRQTGNRLILGRLRNSATLQFSLLAN